jgi:hypothetical protein
VLKQPTLPYDIESGPGGLTREVETPLPSTTLECHSSRAHVRKSVRRRPVLAWVVSSRQYIEHRGGLEGQRPFHLPREPTRSPLSTVGTAC